MAIPPRADPEKAGQDRRTLLPEIVGMAKEEEAARTPSEGRHLCLKLTLPSVGVKGRTPAAESPELMNQESGLAQSSIRFHVDIKLRKKWRT